jgi:ABC-type phosphate/phosphonate transport system permease subunit|tara:strand:+ start:3354 stop:3812 length:459 start_codon:yes stop_codon:yes gene_type:complete
MKALLKWWLIFCLSLLAGGVAVYFDLHNNLYNADQTKLSFLILGLFVLTSGWIGWKTKQLDDARQNMDVGWFIAEACLALGMIGTVTGFLLMLSGAFADIDLANTSTIQKSLTQMALGMSTALYTTLVGLICSLTLKVQLMNVENENQRHEA